MPAFCITSTERACAHAVGPFLPARDLGDSFSYKWEPKRTGGLIPFDVADMDLQPPSELMNAVLARVGQRIFGYGVVPDGYTDAVVRWHLERYRAPIESNWILPTAGTLFGLAMALRAVTSPGDSVVVLKPGFGAFDEIICGCGRILLPLPLSEDEGRYSFDFPALESAFRSGNPSAIVLCNPHNPTGTSWGEENLARFAALCRKYCVAIISDEVHADYSWVQDGHVSICSEGVGAAPNTVAITSPTKAFNMSGMQIANVICADADLRQRISSEASAVGIYGANPVALACTQALYSEGVPWLESAARTIRANLLELQQVCASERKLAMRLPDGGYLAWIDARSFDGSFLDYARSRGYLLSPGTRFGMGGEGFVRVNAACSRECFSSFIAAVL